MRSDIRPYEPVNTFFALRSADLRKARDERRYLAVSLSDKTGQINGYIWDNPEEIADRLREETYVHVEGLAKPYNGTLIVSIEHIRPAQDEEISIDDFLEVVPGGIDLWTEKLHNHIELIRDSNCRLLVQSFLADFRFFEELKISPAGLTVHHNYVGGLLEHTVNTMSHALHVSEEYHGLLDGDLLLTGSFLHDIGKMRELAGEVTRRYTTEGKLLGHISMGLLMVEGNIQLIKGFPSDLGMLIKHMILSHHGSLEFGSPVRPATPEALALHLIENMDAKMNHFYCALRDSTQDKAWSTYDKFLSTEIYTLKFKKEISILQEA
ncbi:MAG: 3'-5' exoribonuclease YhaM family protein [Dissulfurispiraceae bacterium]